MLDIEANSPEFILELKEHDENLFGYFNDWNHGLKTKNPYCMHGGGVETKNGSPK